MSTNELFKIVKGSFKEEDLLPASLIQSDEQLEYFSNRTRKELVPFSKVEALASHFEWNPQHIYFSEKGFSSYFYYNFPVLIDIPIMNLDAIRELLVNERIAQAEQALHHALENGLFSTFFTLIDSRIKIMAFNRVYEQIPLSERYARFISIYAKEDFGFEEFDPYVLDTVFDLQPADYQAQLSEHLSLLADSQNRQDKILTIYRGMESESTSIDAAYSWTVDFSTALYFANRVSTGKGEVYEARVHTSSVLDYLTSRGESEILAKPESLVDIHPLGMVHIENELERLNDSGKMDVYREHTREFDDSLFDHLNGLHGVCHMERVLIHCLSLSEALNLPEEDVNVLIQTALYHDIGRIHDEEDEEHGRWSWAKTKELQLIQESEEDTAIIRFLMEYHCIPDEMAFAALYEQTDLNVKRTEKLLRVFKDADGLDRVRLGDLDSRYLRHAEAVQRVLFAEELYRAHP